MKLVKIMAVLCKAIIKLNAGYFERILNMKYFLALFCSQHNSMYVLYVMS